MIGMDNRSLLSLQKKVKVLFDTFILCTIDIVTVLERIEHVCIAWYPSSNKASDDKLLKYDTPGSSDLLRLKCFFTLQNKYSFAKFS